MSGSQGDIAAPQPPQNRACPSPSTRLKHITNHTAPLALLAGTVELLSFLLPLPSGRCRIGNRLSLDLCQHEFVDDTNDEPVPDCCRCLFLLERETVDDELEFPPR